MARLMLLLFTVASMILASHAGSSPKYPLKVYKDGKDYDEQVSVDVKKGSETFRFRNASNGKDAGVIIYDLKRNLTMIRVPEAKACYLSGSTKNIPPPADLLKLLKLMNGNAAVKITPQTEVKLKVVGLLTDLSGLSKEMKAQCAKLPVYRVTEGDLDLKNMKQANDAVEDADPAQLSTKRTKRGCRWKCSLRCSLRCSGWRCYTVCGTHCGFQCTFG